jgi:hypothetical protein
MKEGHNDMYYSAGEGIAAASSLPFSWHEKKKGIEVLDVVDPSMRSLYDIYYITGEGIAAALYVVNPR